MYVGKRKYELIFWYVVAFSFFLIMLYNGFCIVDFLINYFIETEKNFSVKYIISSILHFIIALVIFFVDFKINKAVS